jgi:hypothetical protein
MALYTKRSHIQEDQVGACSVNMPSPIVTAIPSVLYEVEVLEENLDRLNKVVSELTGRLDPILTAHNEKPIGNDSIPQAQSSLSNDLVRLVSKVKIITEFVDDIIQRVDL